jgi:hypothetical protein
MNETGRPEGRPVSFPSSRALLGQAPHLRFRRRDLSAERSRVNVDTTANTTYDADTR